MGIAALVLGIISFILGLIPFCGIIALLPAFVGVVLGIVDIVNKSKKKENKVIGIIGLILSAVAILFIIIWLFVIVVSDNSTIDNSSSNKINNSISNNVSETKKIEKVEVNVIDFSHMSKDEVKSWCIDKGVKYNFTEQYSDSVDKDLFISQSVAEGKNIYQGDRITIVYSLGKKPSVEYQNALKKAESYSKLMHMSKRAIYDQLVSEYGERFPADAAQYAIDNIVADWNKNALEKAKVYQETMSMSKQAIYDQLISEYGEKFTEEEARYAIEHLE